MKKLTYSAMAAARLRANKKQYISLISGIFLSIFLVTSLVLGVYAIYLAFLETRYDKVGFVDMVMMDNELLSRSDLEEKDIFSQIGTAAILGEVTEGNVYLGFYDETGQALMNLRAVEGRLPENPGELAVEKSAMEVMQVQWSLGETVELDITPVDGEREMRVFTLVGFLPEQTVHFTLSENDKLNQFPALVTCPQEPGFAVGRVGTHHVMKLKAGLSVNDGLRAFSSQNNVSNYYNYLYALTASGTQQQFAGTGSTLDADWDMYTLIAMACALGGALILSCGVGIAGAMEGVLTGRREEIGVLRALGATRRQIRHIFGRENLILALTVSPLSVGIGCLAVWVLSLLLPEKLVFGFNLGLLAPIALFSAAVVLLSGYLPLNRASKLMPMSVIRDTAMLRRNKKVKTKKEFIPARLIASRQIRFNPTRQIGAMLLVGLMLLCSGLFIYLTVTFTEISVTEYPGFELRANQSLNGNNRVYAYLTTPMSSQSVDQIRGLAHVRKTVVGRNMYVQLLLDKVPRYAVHGDIGWGQHIGMLDDEQFRERLTLSPHSEFLENLRKEEQQKYRQFLKDYQITGHAFEACLTTIDLDEKMVKTLTNALQEGKIDIDAVNRGEQVIVMAPEIWTVNDENSQRRWYDQQYVEADPAGKNAVKTAWNDTFSAGQSLPMMQLFAEVVDGPVQRRDQTVTVGAVVGYVAEVNSHFSDVVVLTTERGLANMALYPQGMYSVSVYVEGELALEEEQLLESQLTAITRRTDDFTVYNRMAAMRENEESSRQTILLFSSVTVLFFAVAVGMIVSSVTRQLNSEGRTIGMLRAVGADEKAILGCYSGQVNASVVGGLLITLLLLSLYAGVYVFFLMYEGYRPSVWEVQDYLTMVVMSCAMAVSCWLACRFILRLRIRKLVSKSIIENIKEL